MPAWNLRGHPTSNEIHFDSAVRTLHEGPATWCAEEDS